MVVPASALPERIHRFPSSFQEEISTVGVFGATLSTRMSWLMVWVLPAVSLMVKVKLLVPSGNALALMLQVPSAATVVVATTIPATIRVTVAPASPTPLKTGVRLLTTHLSAELSLSSCTLAVNWLMEVSTTMVKVDELVFPALSLEVTVTFQVPSESSSWLILILHIPLPFAKVSPMFIPLIVTSTRLFASTVPLSFTPPEISLI